MAVDKHSFTPSANKCISDLLPFAESLGHNIPNSFHVFCLCLINTNPSFEKFLRKKGFKIDSKLMTKLINKFSRQNPHLFNQSKDPTEIDPSITSLIKGSGKLAEKYHHAYIGTEHLVYNFLEKEDKVCDFFFSNDIDTEHLKLSILAFLSGEVPLETYSGDDDEDDDDEYDEDLNTEDDDEEKTDLYLRKYCSLLNTLVTSEKYSIISGREKEISLIEEVLCRKVKSNCILVGEAGTGKTTVVEGLAQLIQREDYDGPLLNKKVYALDLGLLIAGTKYRGEFEERFSRVLSELKKSKDNIIFIDEIHTIIGAGSKEGAQDLANLLKPALARGEIKCIGATTSAEYKKYFEKDAALSRRFHSINISEPDTKLVKQMVNTSIPSYEDHHNVKFSNEAVDLVISLCETYLPHQRFPDKVFDVIDQSSSKTRIRSKSKTPKVSISDIYSVIADKAGVDVETIKKSCAKSFSSFEENVGSVVFGQKENLSKIYNVLACAKAGLQSKHRPIASFFFVGPTSVGKTFTAKQISKEFYGNEKSFLQLNMSEYQEQSSISKLIGASAGYVGYEEGGLLTGFVRKNPNSLILFDEAEKCNSSVLNLLLQILDEAKLNDNLNRTVDFSRCIIVLTSNIGSDSASKEQIGFAPSKESSKDNFESSVRKTLSPELVSRIDEIVTFNSLDNESIINILKFKLSEITSNLKLKELSFSMDFSPQELINLNKNPQNHAREIKKTVRDNIEIPLAKFIVQNPQKMKIRAKILDEKVIME